MNMDKTVMIACIASASAIIMTAIVVLGVIAATHDGNSEGQIVTGLLGFLGMVGVGVSTLLGHQFGAHAASDNPNNTSQTGGTP